MREESPTPQANGGRTDDRTTEFGLATPDRLETAGSETAVARNRAFAATGGYEDMPVFPALRLFVITCMDPRVDPAHILGLDLGDAVVLRNGGGRVTREAINDVAFVGQLAENAVPEGPLFEVAIIHHTQCASSLLAQDEFRRRFAERTGGDETELRQYAITDPALTVADDLRRLLAADAISPRITASGHVYDVETGLVETVVQVGGGELSAAEKSGLAAARGA